jgi:hypothetical protein
VSLHLPAFAVLAAAAALGGCASAGASGAATAALAPDGSIQLKVKDGGLFGRRETVVLRPGDPGYDALKASVEVLGANNGRKPVLSWTVGQPVYEAGGEAR